jgi:hypothetical protein
MKKEAGSSRRWFRNFGHKGGFILWTVLYIASSYSVAKRIKEYMEAEGILVRINPLGIKVKENNTNFEILVTEAELEEAQEVLNQALQVKEYRQIR